MSAGYLAHPCPDCGGLRGEAHTPGCPGQHCYDAAKARYAKHRPALGAQNPLGKPTPDIRHHPANATPPDPNPIQGDDNTARLLNECRAAFYRRFGEWPNMTPTAGARIAP